jgi:hypothetical protein
MVCFQEGENDEIINIFAALGVYIEIVTSPPLKRMVSYNQDHYGVSLPK